MVQRLVEWLRDSRRDRAVALQLTTAAARHAHDAFVKPARAVTDGIVIGTARSSSGERIALRIPVDRPVPHLLVQGGTGSGKTTWAASFLSQCIQAGQPAGLIDAKGDLFTMMVRRVAEIAADLPPEGQDALAQRLVIVNPFSDALVPFNVCRRGHGCVPEVVAYTVALALSRLFKSDLGPHMASILRHLVLLLVESDLTLAEAPLVLQDDVLRGVLAHRIQNAAVRDFFLSVYPTMAPMSKDALISRLESLLLSETVRLMLGADDCLDLQDVLDGGKVMLVFLGKGASVPEEQVELVGSLFVQALFQAAYARGTGQRRSYVMVCDEFFHLLGAPGLSRRFATGLASLRTFGLSLALVSHAFAQVPASLREAMLANCDLMALFRTSTRNAAFLGDFLPESDQHAARDEGRRSQLEALQRLPDRHFFWYDRRQRYRAVELRALRVPELHPLSGPFERFVRAGGWDRGVAVVSREELRRQLAARRARLAQLVWPQGARRERPAGRPSGKPGRPALG